MKILHDSRSIRQRVEDENRDADLANVQAKIDFLCLLDGVPVETSEQEDMDHVRAQFGL